MTAHILVACRQMQADLHRHEHRLRTLGVTWDSPAIEQQLVEAELIDLLANYDGIIAGDDELTAAVLRRAAPRLRAISKWGVGVDGIDLGVAKELGVVVTNTPGAFDDDVADVVIGYLIMLLRGLHLIDRSVRGGVWRKIEGHSAAGRCLGIIGLGGIGRAVGRRSLAMGMRVIGSDPQDQSCALAAQQGIDVVPLDEVFRNCDVVSVNCPLTEQTFHLVGKRELAMLRPEAFLINTSRGRTVDQAALTKALLAGRLAGAALDVFEVEPLPSDHPLLTIENVIVGSHNASNTSEAVARTSERALDNLLESLGIA